MKKLITIIIASACIACGQYVPTKDMSPEQQQLFYNIQGELIRQRQQEYLKQEDKDREDKDREDKDREDKDRYQVLDYDRQIIESQKIGNAIRTGQVYDPFTGQTMSRTVAPPSPYYNMTREQATKLRAIETDNRAKEVEIQRQEIDNRAREVEIQRQKTNNRADKVEIQTQKLDNEESIQEEIRKLNEKIKEWEGAQDE